MDVFLHICCAPCSVACIPALRQEGARLTGFWYNPNIHPYQEYKARRDTLIAYAGDIGMELLVREDYGLRDFVRAVAPDLDHRCCHCYACRLEETAQYARDNGFDWFTTTLSISPHKDAARINAIGQELETEFGVKHLPSDFKKHNGYLRSLQLSEQYGLYRQDYCGCEFSAKARGIKG